MTAKIIPDDTLADNELFRLQLENARCIIAPSHSLLEELLGRLNGKHAATIANEARMSFVQYLASGTFSVNSLRFEGCWGARARIKFFELMENVSNIVKPHAIGLRSSVRKFTLPGIRQKRTTENVIGAIEDHYLSWIKISRTWLEERRSLWSTWVKNFRLINGLDCEGLTDWGNALFTSMAQLELPVTAPVPKPDRVSLAIDEDRNVENYTAATQARLDSLRDGETRMITRPHRSRAYGPITGLPSEVRAKFLLGKEPVAEIDLSATYWVLLVAMMPEGKAKRKAVCVLEAGQWYPQFNQKHLEVGQNIKVEVQRQCLFWRDSRAESCPYRCQLRQHHPELSAMIEGMRSSMSARELSILLMQRESRIFIDRAIPIIYRHGILTLSNHDGIIVPARRAAEAQEILESIIYDQVGFWPMVKTKNVISSEFEWAGIRDWLLQSAA